KLERADVGDDGPSVAGREAIPVRIHYPVAVGDDVVKEAVRRVTKLLGVVARRMREAPMSDEAVTVAGRSVARRAVDVEFLAAARERLACVHGCVARRRDRPPAAARASCERAGAEGDRVGLQGPRGPAIGPERAVSQGI